MSWVLLIDGFVLLLAYELIGTVVVRAAYTSLPGFWKFLWEVMTWPRFIRSVRFNGTPTHFHISVKVKELD